MTRTYCDFLEIYGGPCLHSAYLSAAPRVGELVFLKKDGLSLEIIEVVYDLHLSSESETVVRVLVKR